MQLKLGAAQLLPIVGPLLQSSTVAGSPSVCQELNANSLQALLPLLPDLLAPLAESQALPLEGKALQGFALDLLALCEPGGPQVGVVTDALVTVFQRNPQAFLVALTDALEQQAHAAHEGAIHFGSSALCAPLPGSDIPLFQVPFSHP